jgi:hypothetical protein
MKETLGCKLDPILDWRGCLEFCTTLHTKTFRIQLLTAVSEDVWALIYTKYERSPEKLYTSSSLEMSV